MSSRVPGSFGRRTLTEQDRYSQFRVGRFRELPTMTYSETSPSTQRH